jgi:hypothetical protein
MFSNFDKGRSGDTLCDDIGDLIKFTIGFGLGSVFFVYAGEKILGGTEQKDVKDNAEILEPEPPTENGHTTENLDFPHEMP